MSSAEKLPSHRGAVMPADATPEQPARARPARPGPAQVGDEQRPPTRSTTTLRALWVLALVGAAAASAALRYLDEPALLQQSVASALGVLLAIGLAVRSGGRGVPALVIAGLVGIVAVTTQWPPLLAGAAVGTGVVAACLAVLATTPARSFGSVVLQVLVAEVVAGIGALGVAGFMVDVDPTRFAYTVLALSLVATVALVYRLGGGLHGLGRGGALLLAAALVLLVVGTAYTAALARWGSPELRLDVEAARLWMSDHLGAVPHPIELLLGVPALAWGVAMRSRRRQGWWVCAFGTTATAIGTTRLIEEDVTTWGTVLGAAYAIVLGLAIGFVVIRVVRLAMGTPGRRSLRAAATARRTEPPRLQPLH